MVDPLRRLEAKVLVRQHMGAKDVAIEDARRRPIEQLGLGPRHEDALGQRAQREDRAEEQRDANLVAQGPLDQRPRDDERERPLDDLEPREQRTAADDPARRKGAGDRQRRRAVASSARSVGDARGERGGASASGPRPVRGPHALRRRTIERSWTPSICR